MATHMRGPLLACLLLSLTACASSPVVTRTQTVPVAVPVIVAVPPQLTKPVAMPVLAPRTTNGDLASWALELKAALERANAQLRAIAGLNSPAEGKL